MGKIAFLFAGQGAQAPGMGKDLCAMLPAAKEIFDLADSIRPGLSELCFSGTPEELRQTVNAQPAIYCVGLAAAHTLKKHGVKADMMAGFSLGELTALTFSGAVSTENGFRLVCRRGELMQEAGDRNPSVMVAVLKLSNQAIESLCGLYRNIYPVNYNCPGQLVVAGSPEEMESFKADVKAAGGKCVPLPVSGGFHTPYMREASVRFREELDNYTFAPPQAVLYSDYTARPYGYGTDDPRELLSKQIVSPVRWQNIIEDMIARGADVFIECGPGKTLSGFVGKINEHVRAFHVEDASSLSETLRGLNI